MRPEISTATLERGHIATMTEVHDNNAVDIDFHGMAEKVLSATGASQKASNSDGNAESGIVSTIWKGFIEDVTSKPAAKSN